MVILPLMGGQKIMADGLTLALHMETIMVHGAGEMIFLPEHISPLMAGMAMTYLFVRLSI